MTRALGLLGLLVAGHAVAAGLVWTLLNVPESNVRMLTVSAILVLLIVCALGWTEASVIHACSPAVPLGRAMRHGLSGWLPFLVGLAGFALIWWITARVDAWHTMHAGEIDAWWISKTGSPNTPWLHGSVRIALWLTRYVLGVSLTVAILGAGVLRGARGLASASWVRAGCSPRQMGSIGLAIVLLIWLPLRAVNWRPASIPPTSLEIVFVAVKLGAIYLFVNAGWALVLLAGARAVSASSSKSPS